MFNFLKQSPLAKLKAFFNAFHQQLNPPISRASWHHKLSCLFPMFDSSELLEKERVDGGSLFKNILQKQEISKAENEIGEEEKGERSLIFDQLQT